MVTCITKRDRYESIEPMKSKSACLLIKRIKTLNQETNYYFMFANWGER